MQVGNEMGTKNSAMFLECLNTFISKIIIVLKLGVRQMVLNSFLFNLFRRWIALNCLIGFVKHRL